MLEFKFGKREKIIRGNQELKGKIVEVQVIFHHLLDKKLISLRIQKVRI